MSQTGCQLYISPYEVSEYSMTIVLLQKRVPKVCTTLTLLII